MAKYRITGPDGASYEVTAPDNASESDVLAYAQKSFGAKSSAADQIANDEITKGAKSFASDSASGRFLSAIGGAIRGAGSIGATVARPFESAEENAQRRQRLDENMRAMGADPESLLYKGGKLGGEIAGTAGVGNLMAAPLVATKAAPSVVAALQSGGLNVGGMTGVPAWLLRAGAGGATGGAMAGMVDPQQAATGAAIGAALPGVVKVAGAAGEATANAMRKGSEKLMQSALKPTIKQLQTGDSAVAVRTMLDQGISPNAAGVDKLRALADAADDKIANTIAASPAQIDKAKVAAALGDTRKMFGAQVSPASDLQAIQGVESGFLNHPVFSGATIPIKDAQELKRGTYKVLAKKYGQIGGAETEAQKALARGLKDEIAAAAPDVAKYNAELSDLIRTLGVVERRALMEQNKNPAGLSLLAPNGAAFAAFMADRSAALKALAARGLNRSAPAAGATSLLADPLALPLVRGGLLNLAASP